MIFGLISNRHHQARFLVLFPPSDKSIVFVTSSTVKTGKFLFPTLFVTKFMAAKPSITVRFYIFFVTRTPLKIMLLSFRLSSLQFFNSCNKKQHQTLTWLMCNPRYTQQTINNQLRDPFDLTLTQFFDWFFQLISSINWIREKGFVSFICQEFSQAWKQMKKEIRF